MDGGDGTELNFQNDPENQTQDITEIEESFKLKKETEAAEASQIIQEGTAENAEVLLKSKIDPSTEVKIDNSYFEV